MDYTNDTYNMLLHSIRVGFLAKAVGEVHGLDSEITEQLFIAGLFHDFGKLLINQDILNKREPLTEDEYVHLQSHVTVGCDFLAGLPFNKMIQDAVLQHHESLDGSGYPFMLNGRIISLGGHIIKVCDGFDALTSDRPYRKGFSKEKAISIMESEKGKYHESSLEALKQVVSLNDFSYILEDSNNMGKTIIENHLKGI